MRKYIKNIDDFQTPCLEEALTLFAIRFFKSNYVLKKHCKKYGVVYLQIRYSFKKIYNYDENTK